RRRARDAQRTQASSARRTSPREPAAARRREGRSESGAARSPSAAQSVRARACHAPPLVHPLPDPSPTASPSSRIQRQFAFIVCTPPRPTRFFAPVVERPLRRQVAYEVGKPVGKHDVLAVGTHAYDDVGWRLGETRQRPTNDRFNPRLAVI